MKILDNTACLIPYIEHMKIGEQYFYFCNIIEIIIKYKFNYISCSCAIYENKFLLLRSNEHIIDCYEKTGQQL